jgi:hypothetical protein
MRTESREPISTNARKRHKSPNEKPTRPESVSHNQADAGASEGNGRPRRSHEKSVSSTKPAMSRIKLTGSEPTRRLADSKASAVTAQQTAVANAADSPT